MEFAAAAVLAGAAVQSATGFGFALVCGPVLIAVFEPEEAVAVLAALGLVLAVLVLADSGLRRVAWRPLAPIMLAAVPGLAIGLLALEAFSKPVLQLGVGLAVVAAAAVQIRAGRPHEPAEPGLAASGLVGLVSGALTTSIGVNGPPVAMWLEARGSDPGEMRATLAASFLMLNACGFAVLVAAHGAGDVADPGRLLPLVGAVIAGHVVGALAFRRIDAETFRRLVLGLVIAAGAASAVAGLLSL